MRGNRAPLSRRESRAIVDDIEQRLVDFADVMEEGDALERPEVVFAESGAIPENQRVARDAADMLTGFVVVGFDRVEQGLECGCRKTIATLTSSALEEP